MCNWHPVDILCKPAASPSMLPSGNTDLSQTQGWIKSLFILQSHILKKHTDIFSFLSVIPIIVKHNKCYSPHQMQLGSSQQCRLPRVCPVWSVEDVMSLVTNGNRIVAYVMKFVLRHAQPLLLWSRTVPLRDNDCTGQFPGVPHVCEGVGMKQRGAQLAHVFFFWGGGCMSFSLDMIGQYLLLSDIKNNLSLF